MTFSETPSWCDLTTWPRRHPLFPARRGLSLRLMRPDSFSEAGLHSGAREPSAHQRASWSRAQGQSVSRPLGREISVDCMSYKDDGTKQSQDYRDRFGHLSALLLHYSYV